MAAAGVAGEEAVVARHVEAARRDECTEAKEQLARLEPKDEAAVGETALHRVEDPAVGSFLEAALRERRAQAVAAELLEALAIVAVDGAAGVERVAVLARAERRQRILDKRLAARPGGSSGQEQVRLGLVVKNTVVESAAAAQERRHPLDDAVKERDDIHVGGWVECDEVRAGVRIVWARDEDAVGDDDMEVKRSFESGVEALHERDGAVRAGARGANAVAPRAPPLPGEDHPQRFAECLGGKLRIGGEVPAHPTGKRDHPLPIAAPGKDPIHKP